MGVKLCFLYKFSNQGIMPTNINYGVANAMCKTVFQSNFIYGLSIFNCFENSKSCCKCQEAHIEK